MSGLKVAQVCPKYFPSIGGVETHVKEISERLVKQGVDVSVLTTDPAGNLPIEEIINGVKVKRFKSWAPSEAYFFSRGLKSYLAHHSSEYDIVHTHSYHAFPSLYVAECKSKNKIVFTPHCHGTGHTLFRSLLHIPYKFLAQKTFSSSDLIIFVSNYEKNLVLKKFRVDEKNSVIIPNGLHKKEFELLCKKRDDRFLLYVGRLEKYKGIDYIIKVLNRLENDISLEIVGKGPYKETLLHLTDMLNLGRRVSFSQDLSRDDLLQMYADACVFVMLSQHEAYGITVTEALAAGTSCVVANESALREWVDNKSCFGINYPIELDKLANVINTALSKSADKVSVLDWADVVGKIIRLYYSIL